MIDAPFDRFTDRIRAEWTDYNGHMNVAYYFLIFDNATGAFYDWLGIGRAYKESSGLSTFTLEGHITYDRELLEGDPVRVTSRLLDLRYLNVEEAPAEAGAGAFPMLEEEAFIDL